MAPAGWATALYLEESVVEQEEGLSMLRQIDAHAISVKWKTKEKVVDVRLDMAATVGSDPLEYLQDGEPKDLVIFCDNKSGHKGFAVISNAVLIETEYRISYNETQAVCVANFRGNGYLPLKDV